MGDSRHMVDWPKVVQSEKFLDLGTRTWTGRRRMSALVLHAVSRDFYMGKSWSYIWLNAGLTTQSAGAARLIFFLLRHLSKFSEGRKGVTTVPEQCSIRASRRALIMHKAKRTPRQFSL